MVNEAAILNPSEFVPHLAELDLDSIGLAVRAEGVDWGESTIQAQMVKQAQGESSSDGSRPGVPIRIPIRVKEEGGVPLAVAAHKLDAVVARWQEEGGWIRRDYDDAAGFAGSLGYRIIRHTASLSGLQGWLFAHNRDAPDVTLTATRWPIGYEPEKRESDWFELVDREVIWEIEDMGGTAPGLIYINYENQNETEHLRALRAAIECRDHPQDETADTTARLSYDAADLTLRGGSKVVEVEGVEVVENDQLTKGWVTVLSGTFTHAGARSIWLRCMDLGSEAGDVEWRMYFRALAAPRWSKDPERLRVPSRVVDEWDQIDIGQARPQKAALGEEGWELEVQARAPSGSGAMRIHKVWPEPTEQSVLVNSPAAEQPADLVSQKSAGSAKFGGNLVASEVAYPSNMLASDNSYATIKKPAEKIFSDGTTIQTANHGFALPENAPVVGVVVAIEMKSSHSGNNGAYATTVQLAKGGVPVGHQSPVWTEIPSGEQTLLLGSPSPPMAVFGAPVSGGEASNSGFGAIVEFLLYGPGVDVTVSIDRVSLYLHYTEADDPNRACFAGRAIDFRTNGVYRQGESSDAWGRLVEQGSLPYSPPAGLEQRTARGIIVPSQGDLEATGDEGTNAGRAKVLYQPGYLFARDAREAAS